ncbi:MAG: 5'/3'-nucleotidase SurE, partial [Gammaproteobacteria bacterium]
MNILISNDDGCQSAGIQCLAKTLSGVADVTVVAPDRDRSGSSNSLTLDGPIRVTQRRENIICVDGTPTDCVHLAITGLLEQEPDMVVSGINAGGNLGDDVLYSGTVAAAMEGRFLGFPAIAVSLVSDRPTHYDTAARVVVELIARMQQKPVPPNTILNVNVPDRPWEELAGFQATRLGHRHKSEPVIRMKDP